MKLLSDILIVIVLLFIGCFIYVIVEDWLQRKYWKKKCAKCSLRGYACTDCSKYRGIF